MSVAGLMVYCATLSSNTEECILLINYFDPYPTVHMKIDDYISSDDVEWALYGRNTCDFGNLWLERHEKDRSFSMEQSLTKSDAK